MVCSVAGVSSTEFSVRSFTPPSIQRHSAVELCVHWTATHARDWQRAKCATFEVPIKMNPEVMKQLLAVVRVLRRPS